MGSDMTLSQLKKYNGSSPKPIDFDAFWSGLCVIWTPNRLIMN